MRRNRRAVGSRLATSPHRVGPTSAIPRMPRAREGGTIMGFYVINEARSTEFTEASQLAHKAIKRRFKETWDLWIVLKRSNTIVGGVKERWSRMAQLAASREMFKFLTRLCQCMKDERRRLGVTW